MSDHLEYVPSSGTAVEFREDDGPYLLGRGYTGLLSTLGEVVDSRSPGQYGSSAVGASVKPRTVDHTVRVSGVSQGSVWAARQALAAALWVAPTRPGATPELGVLRLYRDGLDTLELDAIPVDSPKGEKWLGPSVCQVEVEWWIPDPRWRETVDRTLKLAEGGGFSFPLDHPWSSLSANVTAEVNNTGSTDTPFVARIHGPLTTPRLILLDTGETIELVGEVADGEHLEVDTGFRRKSVTLVAADGTRTDAMARLNLDAADFWQLPRGVSQVRLEADANPGGHVWLSWRNRFAGV